MRRRTHLLALRAGVILLVVQLAYVAVAYLNPRRLSGPRTGSAIALPPFILLDSARRMLLEKSSGSCRLITFVSSRCPICARMRTEWYARWRHWNESTDSRVVTIWLTSEGAAASRTFLPDSLLRGVVLARQPTHASGSWRDLGVYGTPTSYLLDPQDRLIYGIVGTQLPPVSLTRSACH